MKVSKKVELDLTIPFANVGTPVPVCLDIVMGDDLLPYPNATLTKAQLNVQITFTNPDVEIEGEVVCDISGQCDRCLEEVHKQIVLPFHQIFFKDGTDDGYSYEGSKLDATQAVSDEIVTSLPTLLLCKPDCKGLCPKCGVNRNTMQCDCENHKENAFSVLKNLKF